MSQLDLIYRILAIIFPVLAIVLAGYFYARYRRDTDMSSGNRINMEVFCRRPASPAPGWQLVNYAVLPLILLAMLAHAWLSTSRRNPLTAAGR